MNITSVRLDRLPSALGVLAAVLILAMATTSAASAGGTVVYRDNESYPVYQPGYNACSPIADDIVAFSGTVHEVTQVTQDGSGTFHLLFSYDPEGLKGVDLATGAAYVAVGASSISGSWTTAPYSQHILTQVFRSVLVSQSATPNLLSLTTVHMNFAADGQLVSQVLEFKTECLA